MTRTEDDAGFERVPLGWEELETESRGTPWTAEQYEYVKRSRNERIEAERSRVRYMLLNTVWPQEHEAPDTNRTRLVATAAVAGAIGILLGFLGGLTAAWIAVLCFS